MQLVEVRYIGKKPYAFDNVAGSKKMWQGSGDVQEVTEAQAKILTGHKDVWTLVNKADEARVEAPVVTTVTDEDGEPVEVTPDELKKPIERMTKPQLIALAKEKYSKDLDPTIGKKLMIDQIEEWEREFGL